MEFKIKRVLEYKDLFNDNFDVNAVLKKYDRLTLINAVNVLSKNYGNAYYPDSNNSFFSDYSLQKVAELYPLLDDFLIRNKLEKVCYCTQRSVLELMRLLYSIPVCEYNCTNDKSELEYDLFKILLFNNQKLFKYIYSAENENLEKLLYATSYILNDTNNFDYIEVLRTQIVYIRKLYDYCKTTSEGRELINAFLTNTGIDSFDDYIKTIPALAFMYVDEQKKQRKGGAVLDIRQQQDPQIINEKVCDYISLDINEQILYNEADIYNKDNNIDYRVFRSHPLIKISDYEYIIYNHSILCERLYNSMFFEFMPLYKKSDFFQFFNTQVVEHHIFQKSMLECLRRKKTCFFPDKEQIESNEPIKEDVNQPDFYVRENKTIILFECKAIKLAGSIKDKGDFDRLFEILENKLYLSSKNLDPTRRKKKKDEKVGVTQLINIINLIEDDDFICDKKIPDYVEYYPVIILEDPKILQNGLAGIVDEWYQPLIKEELSEANCHPIILMSIDTIILYSDFFKKYGFKHIFDRFFKENMLNGFLNPMADFNQFMHAKYDISKSKINTFIDYFK